MPARGKRNPSGPAAATVTSGWRRAWRKAKRLHKVSRKHDKGVGQNSGKPARYYGERNSRRTRSHKTAGWSRD